MSLPPVNFLSFSPPPPIPSHSYIPTYPIFPFPLIEFIFRSNPIVFVIPLPPPPPPPSAIHPYLYTVSPLPPLYVRTPTPPPPTIHPLVYLPNHPFPPAAYAYVYI